LTDASADADLPEVRVICGPTAAGKSTIALWLANRAPTTIVSADSRQVYRGFDIGTAKPTADEQSRVPHQGIDVAEPTARYSAAAWAAAANDWIVEAHAERRVPLIVGGTGLYLRALFDGLFEEPPLDAGARESLAVVLDTLGLDELRRWAHALDPARSHLGRTQLLRAIEIALLTGHRLSDLHRARTREPRWRPRYLLVDPGPMLGERIGARIDDMLDHGWPDEVQGLTQTIPENAPAWNATGYDAVRRMIAGALSRDAVRESVLIATRQYAKRQRTWFRHQLLETSVTRVDPSDPNWRTVVERWAGAGEAAA
jgi:tRNA dimethylallyltransferase